MPTMKPATALQTAACAIRFSLVPATAQHQMYEALRTLELMEQDAASGAEVAEIAVCLAIGADDPVILACPAHGARTVRKILKVVGPSGERLVSATIAAVEALLSAPKATVLVCAGKLEAKENYRGAFGFAARHKLPILFLVANTLTPRRRQELDLTTLYAEFGIPVFSVDANDAIAAYRVTTEALHNARHLRGPCVIEALTVNSKGKNVGPLELLRGFMERDGNLPLR